MKTIFYQNYYWKFVINTVIFCMKWHNIFEIKPHHSQITWVFKIFTDVLVFRQCLQIILPFFILRFLHQIQKNGKRIWRHCLNTQTSVNIFKTHVIWEWCGLISKILCHFMQKITVLMTNFQ